MGAFFVEDAEGVFETLDFVVLNEVNAVGLQAPEAVLQLARGLRIGTAVDFRHEERALAIAVAERPAHAFFAAAFIVVPAIVKEGDSAIHGLANDAGSERFVNVLEGKMPAAEANHRDRFAGVAKGPIQHCVVCHVLRIAYCESANMEGHGATANSGDE